MLSDICFSLFLVSEESTLSLSSNERNRSIGQWDRETNQLRLIGPDAFDEGRERAERVLSLSFSLFLLLGASNRVDIRRQSKTRSKKEESNLIDR